MTNQYDKIPIELRVRARNEKLEQRAQKYINQIEVLNLKIADLQARANAPYRRVRSQLEKDATAKKRADFAAKSDQEKANIRYNRRMARNAAHLRAIARSKSAASKRVGRFATTGSAKLTADEALSLRQQGYHRARAGMYAKPFQGIIPLIY